MSEHARRIPARLATVVLLAASAWAWARADERPGASVVGPLADAVGATARTCPEGHDLPDRGTFPGARLESVFCYDVGSPFPTLATIWNQTVALEHHESIRTIQTWTPTEPGVHQAWYSLDDSHKLIALFDEPDRHLVVLVVKEEITNPRLISRVEPRYPRKAKKRRITGEVTLQALVRVDGSVVVDSVLRETPKGAGFRKAAIRAVEQWRYEPATVNGRPVAVYFTIFIDFSLK